MLNSISKASDGGQDQDGDVDEAAHGSVLHLGGLALGFGKAELIRRQVPTSQDGKNAVLDPSWQLIRPLAHRLVGDANCFGGGGYGAPKQFDGLCFVHAIFNHSQLMQSTIVLEPGAKSSTMVEFKDRLEAALAHAKMDAAALARHLGVSSASLSKFKARTSGSMTAANCAKTARRCGVSVYWLATGEGEMLGTGAESSPVEINEETRELVTAFQGIKDPTVRATLLRDVMAAAYRSQIKGDATMKKRPRGERISGDYSGPDRRGVRINDGIAPTGDAPKRRAEDNQ